jgi:ribosomal protein L19
MRIDIKTVLTRITLLLGLALLLPAIAAAAPIKITVEGVLTDEGVECQALRGDDGELYTLTGDLGDFQVGDRVRVKGTVAEASICQQGTTIAVRRIMPDRSRDQERRTQVVRVEGVLTDEGVECPALRGDDGQLYTLNRSAVEGFEIGDRVRVVGKVAEISFCQQGTTLDVLNIHPAKQQSRRKK